MSNKNRIKYGLKNVHYAVVTEDESGKVTYGTPVAWPGAVSLTLSPKGDHNPFYADDSVYFDVTDNNGYDGTLESALVPESFKTDVLGYETDKNGNLFENADVQPKPFALLYEFSGDANQIRHVMYRCVPLRPNEDGKTRGESTEPNTESVSITAYPAIDTHRVKGECKADSTDYSTFFTKVMTYTAEA